MDKDNPRGLHNVQATGSESNRVICNMQNEKNMQQEHASLLVVFLCMIEEQVEVQDLFLPCNPS